MIIAQVKNLDEYLHYQEIIQESGVRIQNLIGVRLVNE